MSTPDELYVSDIIDTPQATEAGFDVLPIYRSMCEVALDNNIHATLDNGIEVRASSRSDTSAPTIEGVPVNQSDSCAIAIPESSLAALQTELEKSLLSPDEKSAFLRFSDGVTDLHLSYTFARYVTMENAPQLPPMFLPDSLLVSIHQPEEDKEWRYLRLDASADEAQNTKTEPEKLTMAERTSLLYISQQLGPRIMLLATS